MPPYFRVVRTRMKKTLRLLVGFTLAGVFLWLIFRHLDLAELRAAFRAPDLFLMALALLLFCLGYACRIERWRLMLLHENSALRWRQCAGPLLGGFAANNILPFRIGDLIRSFGFNRRLGVNAATALTTILVERLLDLLLLLSLLGLALLWFSARGVGIGLEMESSQLFVVGGGVLLAIAIVLMPSMFKPPTLWCCRLAARRTRRLGKIALSQAEKIFAALEHSARGHVMPRLLFWSLLAWMAEGCVFYLAALALPSVAVPEAAWLALPVGTLATLIPSTPGYAGTFDYFTMQAMRAAGNPAAAAAAYAFLIHALLWLPVSLAGGLYLLLYSVDWRADLKRLNKLGE